MPDRSPGAEYTWRSMSTRKKDRPCADQKELFRFEKDPRCVGLPFQETKEDPRERRLRELDLADDRRNAAQMQTSFLEKLSPPPITQEQIARRKKRRRGSRAFCPQQFPVFNPEHYRDPKTGLPICGDWY